MPDRRLPAPFSPWVFAFLMGGVMTAIITASLSLANDTPRMHVPAAWFGNWLLTWLIATPVIVLVAPWARAVASRIAVSPAIAKATAPQMSHHRSRRQRNHGTSK
jgi:hypothetical protein